VRHQRQNASSYSCCTDEFAVRGIIGDEEDDAVVADDDETAFPPTPDAASLRDDDDDDPDDPPRCRSWRERYLIPPDAAKICRPSVAPMRVMMAGTEVPTVIALELLSCDISHAVRASRGWYICIRHVMLWSGAEEEEARAISNE